MTSVPVVFLTGIIAAIDSQSEDQLLTDAYIKYTIEYTYQETLKRPIHIDRYANILVNSRDLFVLYVSHNKDGSVKHHWHCGQRYKTEVS